VTDTSAGAGRALLGPDVGGRGVDPSLKGIRAFWRGGFDIKI